MKVLLVNGSPRPHGCTYTALSEVANQLHKHGIETSLFQIGNQPVRSCIACGRCTESGHCVFGDDGVNEGIDLIHEADGLVIGAPVHYASAAGACSAFFDRVFYAKTSFAYKPAAAVVSCRRGGASATFDQLNKYFTISSMPVVSSQYWNSVHGNTPNQVKQDLEGLQTMRTLADNLAWLLSCIEAGRQSGIPFPAPERRISTSFIR